MPKPESDLRLAKQKTLYINPPVLLRWQPRDKRNQVIFLDLEPDYIDEKTLRIDLNVVFRPIVIRRGKVQRRDYYVGSTGARVIFDAFLGKVRKYTPGAPLKVDYENSYRRGQNVTVKLAPHIDGGDVKADLGEIAFTKDSERSFTTRFSGTERLLSDVFYGNGVEWELKLPEGQVLRDYLLGNLFLYVESSWDVAAREGVIEVRPSDILFFDSERRVIASGLKAVVMLFVLWRRGIEIKHDSIIVRFKEV
jgi:hypothetical protein